MRTCAGCQKQQKELKAAFCWNCGVPLTDEPPKVGVEDVLDRAMEILRVLEMLRMPQDPVSALALKVVAARMAEGVDESNGPRRTMDLARWAIAEARTEGEVR